MIRRPPRSTQSRSSAASDVYKRQLVHDVVRIVLGALDLVLAGVVVRGVDHGRYVIGMLRDRPHPLAYTHLSLIAGREAENVGGYKDVVRGELLPGVAEEPVYDLARGAAVLVRVQGCGRITVGGEPHVVELDLVEACPGGRLCDGQVVVPYLL